MNLVTVTFIRYVKIKFPFIPSVNLIACVFSSGSMCVFCRCPSVRRLLRTQRTSCRWYGIWASTPTTSLGWATKAKTFFVIFYLFVCIWGKKTVRKESAQSLTSASSCRRSSPGHQGSKRRHAVRSSRAASLSLLPSCAVQASSSLQRPAAAPAPQCVLSDVSKSWSQSIDGVSAVWVQPKADTFRLFRLNCCRFFALFLRENLI